MPSYDFPLPPHLEERTNSLRKRISMGWKVILGLIFLQLLVAAGIIYVVVHFIIKWW